MAIQVRPELPSYLRMLLYGRPGCYKTRTASTAALDPRTAPALMLEAAGNPLSIRDYEAVPDIIHMAQLKDFNAPYDWIATGQKKDHPFAKAFDLNPPYRSLIIDQVTEVQRMMFGEVMNYASKFGPGDIVPKREWEHYNKVLYTMINHAKLWFSLPMHVIMVAQETHKSGEDNIVGPLLDGQSAIEVPSYAYVIARMLPRGALSRAIVKRVEEQEGYQVESMAVFKPGDGYDAKDQYGSLGDYMVNPTIGQMLDLIYGIAED